MSDVILDGERVAGVIEILVQPCASTGALEGLETPSPQIKRSEVVGTVAVLAFPRSASISWQMSWVWY